MESEIQLLNAVKKMNEEALAKIFDIYASSLYRYALRLCDDPLRADQIVGSVFEKFVEHLAAGRGPAANLRSYLYELTYQIITLEICSDPWKMPVEAPISTHNRGFSTPEGEDGRELLEAALRVIKYDLTADQCHVLFLRFLEGFTLKETAAIIGKKVGNVKVIQNRAVAALRKSLERQGFEISDPPLDMADFLASSATRNKGKYNPRLLAT